MSFLNKPNRITIGGGGLSGSSVANNQIQHIKSQGRAQTRPTQIIMAEPRRIIGPGSPYDQTNDILKNIYYLNQPAYAMSPFINDQGHFARWLQERTPDLSLYELENSFQTRITYGSYLSDLWKETCQICNDPNFPVEIIREQVAITDADIGSSGLTIRADGQEWQSDSLIIADGHFQNEFLSELKDCPHYFDHPLTHDEINNIPTNNNRVLIVGSGQDMMDRLAELHHCAYTGDIDVVSRRGVTPWVFEPELYHPDRDIPPYQLQFFKPDNFRDHMTHSDFRELWNQEIKRAQNNEYGIGHVLGAFYSNDAIQNYSSAQIQNPEWCATLSSIEAIYGNPTPQHRFDLFQGYINSGRLTPSQGDINIDNITTLTDGFAVCANGRTSQQYDAIINSASCARTLTDAFGQVRSPLIRNLNNKGIVDWSPERNGIIKAGQQKDNRVHYVGPYAYPGKWGCETSRGDIAKTAHMTLTA